VTEQEAPQMPNVALVTGAAGGIGYELCRQLGKRGFSVVACPRLPDPERLSRWVREHPGRAHEVAMDVTDDASVTAAAARVGATVERIDVLFNNAAIYPDDAGGLQGLDPSALISAFDVNAVGPLRVARAMLPLLRRGSGRRLVQITSRMGSIGDNSGGGAWAYRMSKAALNMATRNLALELGGEGFVCLAVHPGWVRTRMGGDEAPLGTREAVADLLDHALGAGREANGSFFGPGGADLPW